MDTTVELSHNRARLVLLLLGPPRVFVNGEAVMGIEKSQKVLILLAYLGVEGHRWHLRSELATFLWPDQPAKKAFQNLRQTLTRLRRAIGDEEADPPCLITDPQTIQFNPRSDCWLDVAVFKTLLARTQQHPHRRLDACPTCVSHLAQAAQLYRGEFLADFYGSDSLGIDEWLMTQREQLRQQVCTALHALASVHLARGEPEAARQYVGRLLQLDPWNEPAHRLVLRALALSEGRNVALQHHEAFRRELACELNVVPEDETVVLVEQIRAGTLADMQPRTPVISLPTPATPFVGREAERQQITDYLAGQDERLITLCGPGGSGKTRLALEIVAEQAPLWQDGVWFVPLAGVPAPEGLVDALAAALELGPGDRPLEAPQLVDFLRPKEVLLILDSFEHLVAPPLSPPRAGGMKGGVELLQDILRWAPEVRILVTSRARLGLRGEWAIPLAGLDVPPLPPPHPSPSEGDGAREGVNVENYSAVQLFLQVARRASPDFTLSPENLPHVARVCRLVGGLPLGIELAAAWARLFPCRQIADEIERSPDFLHNSSGNTPGRQRSLRATFEYSYNLLSDTEQTLFRRLSVFRGGFMVQAAQQVAEANPSALLSLLDKSLLQVSPSRRLDVHLTLRDYAAEKLTDMPTEEWATRERHSHAYLTFVQEREAALRGESPKEALEEIELELGNVREAWRWAVSRGRLEEIDASTEGLSRFYDLRGLFREGETVFGSAADHVSAWVQGDAKAQRVACRLLAAQALFLRRRALYPQAIQVAQAAIELAQVAQEVLCEARATFLWGEALWRQGDHEPARAQLERALSLVRAGSDAVPGAALTARQTEASCLNSLAGVCWSQGDYAGARTYLEQALRVASSVGNRRRVGAILGNLGVVAVEQGDYAEATTYYQQALRTQQEVGDRDGESTTLNNLGNLCLYLGAYAEAKTYYQQALGIHRETGARANESQTLGNLGLLFHYLGENETALEHSQQALRIAQAAGERSMQGARWLELGHALSGLGRLEEAAQSYQNAVALRRELDQSNLATEPLAGLARATLARGDSAEALAYIEEILNHVGQGNKALDGTIDPFQVYLTCYRVLTAGEDPRARKVLATAYDLLQGRAAKITDEAMRRSFLENVASHREIVEEVEGCRRCPGAFNDAQDRGVEEPAR